jgi:hypothetical protein
MYEFGLNYIKLTTGHTCHKPGCGKALVIDGNMKNHRDVCCATNAGYSEYTGLPGRVRTGCPNTPGLHTVMCIWVPNILMEVLKMNQ